MFSNQTAMKIIKKNTKTDILVQTMENGMKTLVCGTKPMNFTPQTIFSKNLATGSAPTVTLLHPLRYGGAGSHHSRWEQSELKNSAVTNLLSPPFRG
jgi:hypothetical protein